MAEDAVAGIMRLAKARIDAALALERTEDHDPRHGDRFDASHAGYRDLFDAVAALVRERDDARALVVAANRQCEAAERERDQMRAVVEAARAIPVGPRYIGSETLPYLRALRDAIDALDAAAAPPEGPVNGV